METGRMRRDAWSPAGAVPAWYDCREPGALRAPGSSGAGAIPRATKRAPGQGRHMARTRESLVERLRGYRERARTRGIAFLDRESSRHGAVANARRAYSGYRENRLSLYAAGFAYNTFLSIFPLLLFAVSVVGFVLSSRPELQRKVIDSIIEALPGLGGSVEQMVESVVSNRHLVGAIGLIGLLWAGTGIFEAVTKGFNTTWGTEPRPFLKRKALELALLLAVGTLGVVTVAVNLLSSQLLPEAAGAIGAAGRVLLVLAGIAVGLFVNFLAFALLYAVIPQRKAALKPLARCSLVVAVAFLVSEYAFNWYFVALSNTRALYGAIGGIIGLLLWLHLTGTILFVGGELLRGAEELERT